MPHSADASLVHAYVHTHMASTLARVAFDGRNDWKRPAVE